MKTFKVKGETITRIIKKCVQYGVFPRCWKRTRIVWTSKGEGSNVRPISLLLALGKILEGQSLRYRLQRGLLNRHVLVITLTIKNTFKSTWHQSVLYNIEIEMC